MRTATTTLMMLTNKSTTVGMMWQLEVVLEDMYTTEIYMSDMTFCLYRWNNNDVHNIDIIMTKNWTLHYVPFNRKMIEKKIMCCMSTM